MAMLNNQRVIDMVIYDLDYDLDDEDSSNLRKPQYINHGLVGHLHILGAI